MKRFRIGDFPIKKKLTWMNMLVSGAALLVASAAFLAYELTSLRVAMVRNLSLQAQISGRNCASALLFDDPQSADGTLAALNVAPNILFAGIYRVASTPGSQPFAEYRREPTSHAPALPAIPSAPLAESYRFSSRSLGLWRPIILQDKLVGIIYIVSDRREESERLQSYGEIVAAVLAISLFAAWSLSSVFQRTIAEPIMALARIARTVSGEKRYSLRAPSTSNRDEVGVLIDAFNEMLANIQDRDAALQQAHERLNLALRSSGTGTWSWSEGDPAMAWDDYMHPLFGISALGSQRLLPEILAMIHPKDRERVLATVAEFNAQRAGGTQSTDVEFRTVWSNGTVHWLTVRGTMFRGQSGKPLRMAGVCWDVSARKLVEEDRQKFVSLIDQSADLIAVAGPDGKLTYLNPSGHALTGLSGINEPRFLPDLFGHAWRERIETDVIPALLNGRNWVGEAQLVRVSDGTAVDVLLNLFPVNDPETGNLLCLAAVARDITERRKLELQLREAQKLETLGQLAGGVAHDFGTLLTVISGFAQLIASQFPDGHQVRESADEIYSAANRATALTRQLLAFGRRQSVLERDIAINSLVRSVEKMLRPLMGDDSDLVLSLDETAGYLRADRGQLEQVIVNLVINARDAIPSGGRVEVGTSRVYLDEEFAAEHGSMQPGEYVELFVADTGSGMTAEVKERIFEPFFTTKEPGKGTGLGLAMVHGIVTQSRAFIQVDSEPDRGTTFRLYFPAIQTDAESDEFETDAAETPAGGTETVLVVDDDAGLLDYLCVILEKHGYDVQRAAGGREALEIIEQQGRRLDLLVCDVVMPEIGGPEVAARFGEVNPNGTILYMSGYGSRYTLDTGESDGVLQKPFSETELLARLRECLDRCHQGLGGSGFSPGR